jgi:hypothetical protein
VRTAPASVPPAADQPVVSFWEDLMMRPDTTAAWIIFCASARLVLVLLQQLAEFDLPISIKPGAFAEE